jgi:hypothetical protein
MHGQDWPPPSSTPTGVAVFSLLEAIVGFLHLLLFA